MPLLWLRAREDRLAGVAAALVCALVLAACSGGGSGDDTTLSAGAPASSAPAAKTSSVTLAWTEAEGPVAGYAVFVQRGTGRFEVEQEVRAPQVTLTGEVGSTARVIVAAFDDERRRGPASLPSPRITFPDPDADKAASASTATSRATTGTGVASSGDAGSDADADRKTAGPVSLAGGLVWQAGDALRVTTADLQTLLLFASPSPGAQLVAVGDFDGDAAADLLWADAAGGLVYTSGASLGSDAPASVDYGLLESGERVLGAGDFDGDGVGDLLVARADAIDVWYTLPGGTIEVAEVGHVEGARLAGIGDFDGDGVDDVAWAADGGLLMLWLMDPGGASAGVEVALGADLEIFATGDFDGDGRAEVAVRDVHGDVLLVRPLVDPATFAATDLADAGPWTSAGAADLDRDGTDELVFTGEGALRVGYLPGDEVRPIDPASPWTLTALLP